MDIKTYWWPTSWRRKLRIFKLDLEYIHKWFNYERRLSGVPLARINDISLHRSWKDMLMFGRTKTITIYADDHDLPKIVYPCVKNHLADQIYNHIRPSLAKNYTKFGTA